MTDKFNRTTITVLVVLILMAPCCRLWAGEKNGRGNMTAADRKILAGADERIEKYRKGDMVLKLIGPNGKPLKAPLAVNIEQTRHEFLFGCTIFRLNRCGSPERNTAYEKHFSELLNFATLPFYWWSYERRQGDPDYERTEELSRWCTANDITTKGHPLAFNTGDPRWLPDDDPVAVMDAQINAIGDRVLRFKNDINIWDVVNEAAAYDIERTWERSPKLTKAIETAGLKNYICGGFKAARNANPNAILIINDYITDETYADRVISQLTDDSGKPLYDVIGIQSHQHGGAWPVMKTWQICQRFAKFDKPLHFTEVTFVSGKLAWPPEMEHTDWPSTPEGEKRQAEYAKKFYTLLFSHPAVEAITWWNFADSSGRRRRSSALLAADITPKPVYHELKSLIKDKWWTKTKAAIDNDGTAAFRGFFGKYKVTATVGDRQLTGRFAFNKNSKKTATVQMN